MNAHRVLITGASSGIGRELARRFAQGGNILFLTGRDEVALMSIADELRQAHGAEVTTFAADLSNASGLSALISHVAAIDFTVDVLVNNAGSTVHGSLLVTLANDEEALMNVQLHTPLRLIKEFVPGMVQRRRGGVLNVGSVYSFSSAPWQAVYGATKGWLLSLSLALREEVRGSGVRITVLCPGTTLSRFRARHGIPDRKTRFTLTCAEVADAGYDGFWHDQAVVVPGVYYKLYVFAAKTMPASWLGRFVRFTAYRLRGMPVPAIPPHITP
jgi:short-subunit dehydrogenase